MKITAPIPSPVARLQNRHSTVGKIITTQVALEPKVLFGNNKRAGIYLRPPMLVKNSSGCPPSGGRERKKIPIGERKRRRFFQGWTVQVGSISQGGEYEVEREEGAALGLGLLIKAGAPRQPVGDSFDL
ncbi:hypothetical protein OIU79_013727 [Salix purpurea]|uniref:Uncharacterized protein n=1 Tax=Salix purpurea TaxID=77065 RepID=A0A9Q0PPW5_SALPP|nr:hypothetical protein OIU79_013727 [Salix purpurea]